jgi:8-oxo-dGTP pyrophosphatase MutT (NUDIX family)
MEKASGIDISTKAGKRRVKQPVRVQYAALPYRFTPSAALEILLVTTRQTQRWIIPKGWPIKGLRPEKSAAREAFEEAGVTGRIGAKSIGLFAYDKILDQACIGYEVRVFPLLVKQQSESWPEIDERVVQWVAPERALAMIKEPELKVLVGAFVKRAALAASKSMP